MKLAPEQENILKEILGSTALALELGLGIPADAAEGVLEEITRVVSEISVEKQQYVLSLRPASSGQKRIDQAEVRRRLRAGSPILLIDLQARLVGAMQGKATHTGCSERSQHESGFEVLVSGSRLFYILKGRVVGEVDVADPSSDFVGGPPWYRRFSQLDDLLDDHMRERLARQQGLEYWKDRRKRILMTGPNGTERIFHGDLYWWLNKFVADALKVYAEPSGLGQDKTDINVVTADGVYVIEVKWLGKNASRTSFGQSRINEGLVQVKLYLERDDSFLQGFLIIYDGRSVEEHRSESAWEANCKHLRCEAPRILFLESETPSEIAPRLAATLGGK